LTNPAKALAFDRAFAVQRSHGEAGAEEGGDRMINNGKVFLCVVMLSFVSFLTAGCGGHRARTHIATANTNGFCETVLPKDWFVQALRGEHRADLLRTFQAQARIKDFSGYSSDIDAVLDIMAVQLDGNPELEYIAVMGSALGDEWLCVFRECPHGARLIYAETLAGGMHRRGSVHVMNTTEAVKPFYIVQQEGHGTGVLEEHAHIYRMLAGRIKKVLVVPHHIYNFCGNPIAQSIRASVEFDGEFKNVAYTYSFAAKSTDRFEYDVELITGDEEIYYHWDEVQQRYVPSQESFSDNFTPEHWACLLSSAPISAGVFLHAFRKELAEVERTGTVEKRQALVRLREAANKEQKIATSKRDPLIR
jgi:hypothetical protein